MNVDFQKSHKNNLTLGEMKTENHFNTLNI